jgi:uncharacterized phage protein (TIGR02218 family)
MKTCSEELIQYIATHNQVATAELVEIAPVDGSGPYRWTTGDVDILGYASRGPVITYKSGELHHVAGAETSNLELELSVGDDFYLTSGKRLQAAALDGDFDDASVTISRIYMSDWGDISLGPVSWFEGTVGPCQPSSTGVVFTVESLLAKLNKVIPRRVFQASCPFAIYDERCGLARTPTSAVVVGCTTNTLTIDSGPAATDWQLGTFRLTSGQLSGVRRQVSSQAGSVLTFALPLGTVAQPGDTLLLYRGCAKTRPACAALGNELRFGGFPYVPRPESVR